MEWGAKPRVADAVSVRPVRRRKVWAKASHWERSWEGRNRAQEKILLPIASQKTYECMFRRYLRVNTSGPLVD